MSVRRRLTALAFAAALLAGIVANVYHANVYHDMHPPTAGAGIVASVYHDM